MFVLALTGIECTIWLDMTLFILMSTLSFSFVRVVCILWPGTSIQMLKSFMLVSLLVLARDFHIHAHAGQ